MSVQQPYTPETRDNGDPIPVKVFVGGGPDDGIQIPVGGTDGVEVELYKDGPTDLGRIARVEFSSLTEHDGGQVNWLRLVSREQTGTTQDVVRNPDDDADRPTTTVTRTSQRPAVVQMYSPLRDEYVTTLYGYVDALGGGGTDIPAQLRIADIGYLLENIPASRTFGLGTPPEVVINYVRDEFERQQPLFGDVQLPESVGGSLDDDTILDTLVPFEEFFQLGQPSEERSLDTQKRFVPNRHTLADVLRWFRDTAGVRVWFQPLPPSADDDVALVTAQEPSVGIVDTRNVGGEVGVAANRGIPARGATNTLTLTGEQGTDIELGEFEAGVPFTGGQYPEATAYVPRLVEAAGGRIRKRGTSQLNNLAPLKTAAKSQLKDILDSPSGKPLITTFAPTLKPYDGIRTAVTAQQARSADDPVVIEYEIEEITHRVRFTDDNVLRTKTEMYVSNYTPLSEIEVEGEVKEVK